MISKKRREYLYSKENLERLKKLGEENRIGEIAKKLWSNPEFRESHRRDGKNSPFYGKHHSKETKQKQSIIKKGKHFSLKTEYRKGNVPWIKGRGHSEQSRKKMSKTKKLLGSMKKEKNPKWKGGISKLPYPFEFDEELKEMIRARDNFTCKLCGLIQNGQKFHIHHIDYDKKNINPNNLITLCKKCHLKTNDNREQWINFFGGLNVGNTKL